MQRSESEAIFAPSAPCSRALPRQSIGAAYVRRLASLAYLSPRFVEAIAEGRGGADLTATKALGDLPLSWAEQEKRFLTA
jgi:hypothetical protein